MWFLESEREGKGAEREKDMQSKDDTSLPLFSYATINKQLISWIMHV